MMPCIALDRTQGGTESPPEIGWGKRSDNGLRLMSREKPQTGPWGRNLWNAVAILTAIGLIGPVIFLLKVWPAVQQENAATAAPRQASSTPLSSFSWPGSWFSRGWQGSDS